MCLTLVLLVWPAGPAAHASPLKVGTSADSASQRLLFHNESISPIDVLIGGPQGAGFAMSVDRFSKAIVLVQCMADAARTPPELTVELGGSPRTIKTETVDLTAGAPAIWLSNARSGRARLESLLKQADPGSRLVHRAADDAPRYFSGIRFAPMVLASLESLARLEEDQRDALLTAVAGGTVLVIAAGESAKNWPGLQTHTGIDVGHSAAAGPELRAMLPTVVARRQLTLDSRAFASLSADGDVLVAQTSYGLGAIRVVGTAFENLAGKNIAQALFTRLPDSVGPLFSWLTSRSTLTSTQRSPIGVHLVAVLLILPLGLWFLRRRPKVMVVYSVIWSVSAAFVPVHLSTYDVGDARAVVVPAGEHSLVFGLVELTFNTGGDQLIRLGEAAVSLDDVRGGALCLLDTPGEAVLMMKSNPGQAHRVLFVRGVENSGSGEEQVGQLRGAGRSALRGAVVRRRSKPIQLKFARERIPFDTYQLDLGIAP